MIAIIDVCGNNLNSLAYALQRLGFAYQFTHDPAIIMQASHVILPGVGTAAIAMQALVNNGLVNVIQGLTQPVLGICLGMQLLFDYSEEGNVDGLGIIKGRVQSLVYKSNCPIPHMGWNKLNIERPSAICANLPAKAYLYFVHGYAVMSQEHQLASCQYSQSFSAIVQHNNFYGMQFHPEKSAKPGLLLLNNFLTLESL